MGQSLRVISSGAPPPPPVEFACQLRNLRHLHLGIHLPTVVNGSIFDLGSEPSDGNAAEDLFPRNRFACCNWEREGFGEEGFGKVSGGFS